MGNRTTIACSKQLKDRLDEFGGPSDSYEDVIEELLDVAEARRRS